jgi:hypothetical protein
MNHVLLFEFVRTSQRVGEQAMALFQPLAPMLAQSADDMKDAWRPFPCQNYRGYAAVSSSALHRKESVVCPHGASHEK